MIGMAAKKKPFFQVSYPPPWPPLICLTRRGAWGATRRNFWYDLEEALLPSLI